MRISTFREKWENLAKENGLLRFCVLVLTAGLIVEGLVMAISLGKTSVVIQVPEYLKKDFSIREGKPSSEYFEQWALSLVPYVAGFTPESVDFNIRVFLSYVHPKSYGSIETELIKLRDEVKSVGISQAFFPQQVVTKENKVRVIGHQMRFVGKTVTSDEVVAYEISFRVEQGKPLIESMSVTTDSGRKG
jgi:type IV conjugative transfer system protein TraE